MNNMIAWMRGETDVSPFGDSLQWEITKFEGGHTRSDSWGYININLYDDGTWSSKIIWNESDADEGSTHQSKPLTPRHIYDLLVGRDVVGHVARMSRKNQILFESYETEMRAWVLGGERSSDMSEAWSVPVIGTLRFCAGVGRPTFDFSFHDGVWSAASGETADRWSRLYWSLEQQDDTFNEEIDFYLSQFYPED